MVFVDFHVKVREKERCRVSLRPSLCGCPRGTIARTYPQTENYSKVHARGIVDKSPIFGVCGRGLLHRRTPSELYRRHAQALGIYPTVVFHNVCKVQTFPFTFN